MATKRDESAGGARSVQVVLDGIIHDLGSLVERHGVRTEEMIRVAGFFESVKALWLATSTGRDPMPSPVLAHRLRVLVDICPPELKEYGERLELALKILDESANRDESARKKRA